MSYADTSDPIHWYGSYLKFTRLYINLNFFEKRVIRAKRFEIWTMFSMWRSTHINSVTWLMGNYNQSQYNQRPILSQSSLVPMILRLVLDCHLCVMDPQCNRALSFKPENNGYVSWNRAVATSVLSFNFVTCTQVEHSKLLSQVMI